MRFASLRYASVDRGGVHIKLAGPSIRSEEKPMKYGLSVSVDDWFTIRAVLPTSDRSLVSTFVKDHRSLSCAVNSFPAAEAEQLEESV
jgi:hypothetical protein